MELTTNDRFMILGVSLLLWFLLIFNIVVPNEGFIQVMVPRSILIAEMVAILVLGLFLAVTSMYLSMVEIQKHFRSNNKTSLFSDLTGE
jgi:hypothetical protein